MSKQKSISDEIKEEFDSLQNKIDPANLPIGVTIGKRARRYSITIDSMPGATVQEKLIFIALGLKTPVRKIEEAFSEPISKSTIYRKKARGMIGENCVTQN